jgi:hypothetical protein
LKLHPEDENWMEKSEFCSFVVRSFNYVVVVYIDHPDCAGYMMKARSVIAVADEVSRCWLERPLRSQ